MNKAQRELNPANLLTALRIISVPVFLVFLYFDKPFLNVIACVIYTVFAVTDYVDGYIARKYNMVTDLGKILDPVADKIFVAATMIALVEMGRLEGFVLMIILTRDFAVGALRNLAASKGIIIAAGNAGKWKTGFQMTGVGCIIFKNSLFGLNVHLVGTILVYISLIFSMYSAWEYFRGYYRKPADENSKA
jgi:CDP-diacylglycerol--glycerol-3-phosphate 3-phosphatidyltransferase/cardiolipin synthase